MKTKMPNSLRKYIRKEKARIRRGVLNVADQQGLIDELYKKHFKTDYHDNPGNIRSRNK